MPERDRPTPLREIGPLEAIDRSRATAGDVARHAIHDGVRQLLEQRAGIGRPEDHHAIHQARVATRRLRSDLRSFGPFLEASWTASLRDDLRWLGTALGRVRDTDVLLARLELRAAELPDAERLAVESVLERLRDPRSEAHARLVAALEEPRASALTDRLVVAARAPRLLGAAGSPATRALEPVVRRPWRRLRDAVGALADDPADHALHEVRILAKRCRYATEAVTVVLGRPARRFSRALAALQDTLGEHQDAVVARAWLAKAAADVAAPEAFAAGMLADAEVAAARDARAAFPRAWERVRRRRPATWR
jgi:CHAD domain-containing protein